MGMALEEITSGEHVMDVMVGIVHGNGFVGVICDDCPLVSCNIA